jgi:HTH-type transcriptional regulator/antitoxin HigA
LRSPSIGRLRCPATAAEIRRARPIEAIKFRMEQHGLTRKDLDRILGNRTRIAEVLNRRRGLSINMIRRLHEKLGISEELLIDRSHTKARLR